MEVLNDVKERFLFDAIVRANASESVTEAVSFIAYKMMASNKHYEAIQNRRLMLSERLK